MNDTDPKITEKMIQMINAKSPIERLKMGQSMNETSRMLVMRFIMENNPNISKEALKKEFFLKFYGEDFTEEQKEKISTHLLNH